MIVRDKIYIDVAEVGKHVSDLCLLYTYKNPEYYSRRKLKLSVRHVPVSLYHYNFHGNKLEIPRGGFSKLSAFFKSRGLLMRVVDLMENGYPIDCSLVNTELTRIQEYIISLLIENKGGLIESPPGSGKTIAMLGLINKLKVSTLILVHEHRLRSQWENEIKMRLVGNYKLGRLDGDKKEDGDIVTAIINSALSKLQEDKNYFDKFGLLIVDEAHHVPASGYLSVVNNLPMRYRVGITGTIERKDGRHILMYDIFGDVLASIKPAEIKDRITYFDFEIVNTNIPMRLDTRKRWTGNLSEDTLDFSTVLDKLLTNPERNAIIVNKIVDLISNGYFPLVLSLRISHLKYLHEFLTSLGYKSLLLIGENRTLVDWVEVQKDESIQCICASDKIAAEGLDLPRLSALVLTCPTTNLPKLIQKVGRIRRVFEGKKLPKVVDFCDNLAYMDNGVKKVYVFQYSAKKRIRLYKKLQLEYSRSSHLN